MKKIVLITLCLIGLIGFAQAATSGSPAQTVSNSEASVNQDIPHLTLRIWQEGEYGQYTGVEIWNSHTNGGIAYVYNSNRGVYPLEFIAGHLSERLYLPTSEVLTLSIEKFVGASGQSIPFTWNYQFD